MIHNTIVLRFWVKSGIKCLICLRPMSHLLHILDIKKRRYHQNYYIIHFLLLTLVMKNSFFIILKLCYKKIQVQILQKSNCFYFFHLFMI